MEHILTMFFLNTKQDNIMTKTTTNPERNKNVQKPRQSGLYT